MPGFDDLCPRTTLARKFVAPDSLNYFDLEDPRESAPSDRACYGPASAQEGRKLCGLFPSLSLPTPCGSIDSFAGKVACNLYP
jgi:hypothetical protein